MFARSQAPGKGISAGTSSRSEFARTKKKRLTVFSRFPPCRSGRNHRASAGSVVIAEARSGRELGSATSRSVSGARFVGVSAPPAAGAQSRAGPPPGSPSADRQSEERKPTRARRWLWRRRGRRTRGETHSRCPSSAVVLICKQVTCSSPDLPPHSVSPPLLLSSAVSCGSSAGRRSYEYFRTPSYSIAAH